MKREPAERLDADALVISCENLCYTRLQREFGTISSCEYGKYGVRSSDQAKPDAFYHVDSIYGASSAKVGQRVWFARHPGSPRERAFPITPAASQTSNPGNAGKPAWRRRKPLTVELRGRAAPACGGKERTLGGDTMRAAEAPRLPASASHPTFSHRPQRREPAMRAPCFFSSSRFPPARAGDGFDAAGGDYASLETGSWLVE